ncbi:beta-glucuronosyltransferase GlcAT14A-like [Nicotiana tabacum]|uniref:Beta-glucuronosyltransferase GlcAT14A-like n=1 Tax=Nicotiana tabacum TaxID=4097 RepID=A0A1S3XP03_TOBAC
MHNHNHLQPPPTTISSAATTTSICRSITFSTPFILLITTLFSLLLILSLSFSPTTPPPHPHPSLFPNYLNSPSTPNDQTTLPPTPPSIAYLISGSTKDSSRILRLLFSIYHPRNQYLIHLDKKTSKSELNNLALTVQSVPVFKAAQNVNVIGKADFRYKIGSCSLAAKLHGASILLKLSKSWDWFINLSAADYPLVTQDDLLHILSYLPKDLNFVNHSSYIGWRESKKLKLIVVDPGLYLAEESEVYYATQKRVLPDAYRLFTGSSSAILTRKFIEYCILGSENLPRTLLMYLSNSPSSESVYFPTILCNSQKFNRTTINHNMLYASLNSRSQARRLNSSDFNDLLMSGAAFASPFKVDDPVLDQIDHELLHHNRDEPVPGGWCLGDTETNKCSVWGDAEILRPGPGAKRLEKHFLELFSNESYLSDQCQYEKSSSSR